MNLNILGRIDQKLKEKQDARKDRVRSGKWSPSSFGRCYRNQYWNRKNEPQSNPPEARSLRIFEAGHLFHKFVQEIISQSEEASIEVKIESEDTLGYADIVLKEEVADIKTQRSDAFHYMHTKSFNILSDKKEHVLQVLWYAVQLQKEWIRLVYVSKDDLLVEEYRVKVDDYLRGVLQNELAVLNGFWESATLPPALPRAYVNKDGKSNECKYCAFLDKCKGVESAGKT